MVLVYDLSSREVQIPPVPVFNNGMSSYLSVLPAMISRNWNFIDIIVVFQVLEEGLEITTNYDFKYQKKNSQPQIRERSLNRKESRISFYLPSAEKTTSPNAELDFEPPPGGEKKQYWLPDEIWKHILKYLSVIDLVRCQRVQHVVSVC